MAVTWSINDKSPVLNLSNNNLTVTSISSSWGSVRATLGKQSGKWYWEETMVDVALGGTASTKRANFGVSNKNHLLTDWLGVNLNSRSFQQSLAFKYPDNISYGTTLINGDVLGIALDLDNGIIEYYKNGISLGVAWSNINDLKSYDGFVYASSSFCVSGASSTVNFGATPFKYSLPKGHKAYNTSHKILLSSRDGKVISTDIPAPPIDLVPKMTTNTAPSGVVTASSTSTSGIEFRVFDKNKTGAVWVTNNKTTGWIQYKFSQATIVNRYGISPQVSALARSPKKWRILASNTGAFTGEETILDSRGNVTSWDADTKYFDFNNNNPYLYYRLEIIENNGDSTYTGLAELEFLQRFPQSMIILSSFGEEDFIKYGTNSLNFDRAYTTCKDFNKEFLTLGSGKTFEHTVDLSKRRVDKIILN